MSLLKTVKPEEAEGLVAEMYKPMQELIGQVPAPMQLMSASPKLMETQGPIRNYYFDHPTLKTGLLALIRLCVAEEMKYNYCIGFNRNILKMLGIADDDQLAAVMADPNQAPLEEKEKAMLAMVVKACSKQERLEASEVQKLRDLGWTDADILDAVSHGLMMVTGGVLEKAFGLPDGAAC